MATSVNSADDGYICGQSSFRSSFQPCHSWTLRL